MRTLPTVLVLALVLGLSTSALAAESAGGLTWTAPQGFSLDVPRQMRVATYKLPIAKGDSEAPELAVFYFGQGQGGAIDANVQRWAAQFHDASGKPATPEIKREKLAGLPVTTVGASGTYQSGGMGMGPAVQKPGFRLLGAIVEGPQGAVFFKLTGPSKSVEAAQKDFKKLLASLKPQG